MCFHKYVTTTERYRSVTLFQSLHLPMDRIYRQTAHIRLECPDRVEATLSWAGMAVVSSSLVLSGKLLPIAHPITTNGDDDTLGR